MDKVLAQMRFAFTRVLPYIEEMQTQNPFLDEFAKLTTAFMGIAASAGDEAKTALRSQADRIAAELDLVRREDFEALNYSTRKEHARKVSEAKAEETRARRISAVLASLTSS
jgi:BMFP domain-containing protein YqiC